MRAVGIRGFGGPEVLTVLDVPAPEPRPGEVLVKVLFAGVNFIDLHMRKGEYARGGNSQLPRLLGREGAGEVVRVGPGVTNLKPGDRVAWCVTDGSYSELCAIPSWRLWPVPADMPLDVACALQLQGSTAHYLTSSTFPLTRDDVALVHSGASGVGQLLIQMAKARGAKVIATVGKSGRAAVAAARGADEVIARDKSDFQKRSMEITGGRGCNVVYDAVGKETIAKSIAACRRRGLVVLYGGSSGAVDTLSPLALAEAGSVFFTRPHLADYMQDAEEVRARATDIAGLWRSGRLKIDIARVFPLDGAGEAHAMMESGSATGKLLLKPVA